MFFFPHPAPSPGCGTLLKLFPSPRRSNAFRGLGLRNGRRKIEPSRAARPSRNSNGSNGRLPALSSTTTTAPSPAKKNTKIFAAVSSASSPAPFLRTVLDVDALGYVRNDTVSDTTTCVVTKTDILFFNEKIKKKNNKLYLIILTEWWTTKSVKAFPCLRFPSSFPSFSIPTILTHAPPPHTLF